MFYYLERVLLHCDRPTARTQATLSSDFPISVTTIATLVACSLLAACPPIRADTVNLSAVVRFISPLVLSDPTPLSFGSLEADITDGSTLTVAPDSTVSGTAVASADYITGATAGSVDVAAAVDQTVSVSITDISSTPGNPFILSEPTCAHTDSGTNPCSADDSFAFTALDSDPHPLFIGMTLTTQGPSYPEGDYSENFDVVVVYQ